MNDKLGNRVEAYFYSKYTGAEIWLDLQKLTLGLMWFISALMTIVVNVFNAEHTMLCE
jgi:hypothetical protein